MKRQLRSLLTALSLLYLLCLSVSAADSVTLQAFRPSEDGMIQVNGSVDEPYWLLDTPVGTSRLGALCDGQGLYLAFRTQADSATFTINGVSFTCTLGDSPRSTLGSIVGKQGVYEMKLGYTALSIKPQLNDQCAYTATLGDNSVSGTLYLVGRGLAPAGQGRVLTAADYVAAATPEATGNITLSSDGVFTFRNDTADSYYSCSTKGRAPWNSLSDNGYLLSFEADFRDLPTSSDSSKPMYNFGLFWFIRTTQGRQDMAFWSDAEGQVMFTARQATTALSRKNAIPTGIYLDTPQAQNVQVRILLDPDNNITLYINGDRMGSLAACPPPIEGTTNLNQFAFYVDHRKKTSDRVVDVTFTDFALRELAGVEARKLYSMGLVLFTNDDDPTALKSSSYSVNRLVTFDTNHNSLAMDLGSIQRFNRIHLFDTDQVSRVSQNDLGVYISTTGKANSWTKVTGWQLHQEGNRYTLYNLDETARYVKVHCYLDALNDVNDPVPFAPSFTNYIADIMTVEYSPYLLGAGGDFAHTGSITLRNPGTTDLYDQPVALTLEQIGAARGQYLESCADFRFTLGQQLLPHWYDGQGTFHVRVPAIPAGGSVLVTPHWGHPEAQDVSDHQATFEAVYGNVSLIDLSQKTNLASSGRAFTFPDGSIIAVARAVGDGLAVVSSTDGGRTFTPTAVDLIPDDHWANMAGFGSFLWDESLQRLFLVAYHAAAKADSYETADCRFVLLYTDDYGKTWSDPVVLSDASAAPATDHDVIIQNSQGRRYQLSYCDALTLREADGDGPNVDYVITHSYLRPDTTMAGAALFSRDGGKTWIASDGDITMDVSVGHENGISETAFAQLDDGSLYIVARAQATENLYFYEAWSYDGGNTWTQGQPSKVIATNTSPVFLPYGKDRLLLWAGNNTLGGNARRRLPLSLAISSDNYQSYDRSLDLTLGTAYDTLSDSIERITQPSLSVNADRTEAFVCWTNLRQSRTVAMLVEEFGDMIYKTRGASDGFECTSIKGEGWLLGDVSGTSATLHVAGSADITTDRASGGERSLRLTDNSTSRPAYLLRQIPSMRVGTVGASLYIPSDNTSDYVLELKHAFNYTTGHFTLAGFGVTPKGSVFLVKGSEKVPVGTVPTDCWNRFAIEFDMVDTKKGTLLVNGTAMATFDLDLQSDRITAVTLCEPSATSGTGSTVYLDDFFAVESAQVEVESALPVSEYKATGTLPQREGCVFAGFYTTADLAAPYRQEEGFAYPKFVSNRVLRVMAQISAGTTAQSPRSNLRLITTVDDLNYQEVGFLISFNGQTVRVSSRTVYTQILSAQGGVSFPYAPTIFHEQSSYFMTFTITDIPNAAFNADIVVTPYWITLDGMECHGITNTLRVSMGYAK